MTDIWTGLVLVSAAATTAAWLVLAANARFPALRARLSRVRRSGFSVFLLFSLAATLSAQKTNSPPRGGTQLPRPHADRLHAVAGVRNGRPLPALRGLPQAIAGDVGEDALRGDPRPRPRVGAARRGRRDADAAVPPRRLKSDGERRPDLNAVAMIPSLPAGERGMFAFEFQPPRLCASARDKKTSRQTRQENPVP